MFAVLEAVASVFIAYLVVDAFSISDPIWVILLATAISTAVAYVSPLSPGVA